MKSYIVPAMFCFLVGFGHVAGATQFTVEKVVEGANDTMTGILISEKTTKGDTYTTTYTTQGGKPFTTEPESAGKSSGMLDVFIQPKPTTTYTVTNLTEKITKGPFVASANDIFTPGVNVVVSDFTVNPGSQLTFAGNTFALTGGFTTIETNVDYNPQSPTYGSETGHVQAVDLVASGAQGLTFAFGLGSTQLNLAPVWAQVLPTGIFPAEGISVPDSFAFSGMLDFDSLASPFTGDFNGAITFFDDGSTTALGALTINTDFGPATGTLSASALPRLVPEPASLSLLSLALIGLAFSRRR